MEQRERNAWGTAAVASMTVVDEVRDVGPADNRGAPLVKQRDLRSGGVVTDVQSWRKFSVALKPPFPYRWTVAGFRSLTT